MAIVIAIVSLTVDSFDSLRNKLKAVKYSRIKLRKTDNNNNYNNNNNNNNNDNNNNNNIDFR